MRTVTFFILVTSLFSCSRKEPTSTKIQVVATTGMLYDAVLNVVGDKMDVKSIMGPGVDPHLYKATQGDLSKLNRADIVVYNGLYLEGKMGEILEKLARQKPVLAAAESIPDSLIRSSEFYDNSPDPHVWFDVTLWKHVVDAISNKMQEIDSTHKAYYALNTDQYLQLLDTLHLYAQNQIGSIPDQQRILVTAHDAFGYFGEAYSIQVKGLQGISTVSEFGLRDIAEISDLIIDNGVKSIFVETSVSDRAIKAVINGCREKGHDVTVGGSLFSDAMGEIGTFEGTYIGMVKTNVDTITEALK